MKKGFLLVMLCVALVSSGFCDESIKDQNKKAIDDIELQKKKSKEVKATNKTDKYVVDERYIKRREKSFLLLDYQSVNMENSFVISDWQKVKCKFKGGRLIDLIKSIKKNDIHFNANIPINLSDGSDTISSMQWFESKEDRKKFIEKHQITFEDEADRNAYIEGDLSVKNLIIHEDLWDYPIPEIEFNEVGLISLLEYVFETSYTSLPKASKYKDYRILLKLRDNFTSLSYDLANKEENADSLIVHEGRKIMVRSLNIFNSENKMEQVTNLLSVLESFAKESGDDHYTMKYHDKTSMLYINCDIKCEEMINSTLDQVLKDAETALNKRRLGFEMKKREDAENQLKRENLERQKKLDEIEFKKLELLKNNPQSK